MEKMSDRELLESAALAAGVKGKYQHWEDDYGHISCGIAPDGRPGREWWNPLKDDTEALGLIFKLNLNIYPYADEGEGLWDGHKGIYETGPFAGVFYPNIDHAFSIYEKHNGNPPAAMRRAIVRAAAEIGIKKWATESY